MSNNKPKVILFCGKAGSGKDSAAEIFKRLSPGKVVSASFAKSLKQHCGFKYEIPMQYFDDRELKESDLANKPGLSYLLPPLSELPEGCAYWTPRALAIYEGGKARAKDINTWVDVIIRDIKVKHRSRDAADTYLITDYRFPNERNRIDQVLGEEFQVLTVKIIRPQLTVQAHHINPSETALDGEPVDHTILNNSASLIGLEQDVQNFIYELSKQN